MVRSLCVTALEVRHRLERTAPSQPAAPPPLSRKTTAPGAVKRRETESPTKKKMDVVASPEAIPITPATGTTDHRKHPFAAGTAGHHTVSLFAPPPSARQPLLPSHVLEAFAQIQRQQASTRLGGMRNFQGGKSRVKVALV